MAELAQELPRKSDWLVPVGACRPRQLHVHALDLTAVYEGMERFHYLRSARTDGRAYGLSTNSGALVGFCVSSPIDVPHLQQLLASNGGKIESARTISRVFVFDGAPNNSISYMLSRVSRAERRLGITDFVTYVNPNMAFDGISYRASGWRLLGFEEGTKYRYLDSRYITDRQLVARFGARRDHEYQGLLRGGFATSSMPLKPLWVFHRRV
ncbi:MAG TPA: hypothetical protein VNY07_12775 [Chthoniobacterales bacterium]|nr:hypothetical protein [Chthoniobacterales bacterium]